MEMIINNYPINRVGGCNYRIQERIDEFANSDFTVMTIVIPKSDRARIKGTWKTAIARSRRHYIVEIVDVGIQIRRR